MRRWLSNAFVIVTLGISILCSALWVRSAWGPIDEKLVHVWWRSAPPGTGWAYVEWRDGVLEVSWGRNDFSGPEAALDQVFRSTRSQIHVGWRHERDQILRTQCWPRMFAPRLVIRPSTGPWRHGVTYRERLAYADVPLWQPALLFALPAILWERRVLRRRRRIARKLCPSCGYDLRATPDRCPECGWVVRESESVTP